MEMLSSNQYLRIEGETVSTYRKGLHNYIKVDSKTFDEVIAEVEKLDI